MTFNDNDQDFADFPVFTINIKSSNLVDQFKRSYITVFDLFGDIGGTGDMILFLIVLFYVGYNTYFFEPKLPVFYSKKFMPEETKEFAEKTGKDSNKENKEITENKKKHLEVMKELVEEGTSLENLVSSVNVNNFFNDIVLTNYQKKLLPIASLIMKKNKLEEEEKDEKEENKGKKVNANNLPNLNLKKDLEPKEEPEVSFEEAISILRNKRQGTEF